MTGTDLFLFALIVGWWVARERLHEWQLRKRRQQ